MGNDRMASGVHRSDTPRWHRVERNEHSDPDVTHSSIYGHTTLVGIYNPLFVWRLLRK
jgi:hypothetical protein